VFKHYFEELEEESLRDNFVVVVRGAFLRCT
jgi:methanogenic corrinoid protein MtbC1